MRIVGPAEVGMNVDALGITEPCHEDWERMTPEGRRRFCASCRKHVHDLSSGTEAEAEAILAQPDVCVRVTVVGDRVRFASPRRSVRGLLAVGALLSAGPALASGAAASPDAQGWRARLTEWLASWTESAPAELPGGRVSMGEVAPALPAPPPPPVVVDDEEGPRPHKLMGRPARRQPPAESLPSTGARVAPGPAGDAIP